MCAFVDANDFLRYFTLDDAGRHGRAVRLFGEASQGDIDLVTGPPVLLEAAGVDAVATLNRKDLERLDSVIYDL